VVDPILGLRYGLANNLDHPKTVYLREDQILSPLDSWLASCLAPVRVAASLSALATASTRTDTDPATTETEQARRVVAECDRKLARHKAALEAGADPALVAA